MHFGHWLKDILSQLRANSLLEAAARKRRGPFSLGVSERLEERVVLTDPLMSPYFILIVSAPSSIDAGNGFSVSAMHDPADPNLRRLTALNSI